MTDRVPDGTTAKHRYLVFSGPMSSNGTKNLRSACCSAVNDKVTNLSILFSSWGGVLDEGFALYGFLSALPLELTMHNIGVVTSIANIAFLAGEKRYANENTMFYFHDEGWTLGAQDYTDNKLIEYTQLLESSRNRAKSIFKLRTKLDQTFLESDEFFKKSVVYEASVAKTAGIVHEVQDVTVPFGEIIYNVDWV
jgi:ATP-dependent protease ClpP protease subunit